MSVYKITIQDDKGRELCSFRSTNVKLEKNPRMSMVEAKGAVHMYHTTVDFLISGAIYEAPIKVKAKKKKKKKYLYPLFKKLKPDHGMPYICRELNIDSDQYYKLLRKYNERE